MRNRFTLFTVLIVAVAAFIGGYLANRSGDKGASSSASRKILCYVDPMHPSYKSDRPGIAPDCGMQLEPVYAEGNVGGGTNDPAPQFPGTVRMSQEYQQLIGVQTATVEKSPLSHTIRVSGRVAADETRIYRINSAIDGWIKKTLPVTTGSLLRKGELLAAFYSPEFLSATQAYLFALGSLDRYKTTGKETKEQITLTNNSIENYKNTLRNLGMSEYQMDEIGRTRHFTEQVDIRSPAAGMLLVRNVSDGQRFERGIELFRIADLSRVWILADTFENEATFFRPGMRVRCALPNHNKSFYARVSNVLPQFDATSRTLKVRLEADNPGLILRPDMFVDVELPVSVPSSNTVPVEALLDSGLKKTIFVERGAGIFEPRQVETGRSFGNRVEIVSGLKEGERIAVSGTFLLDSESRMKTAALGIAGTPQQDPVCGMYLDETKSRAAGNIIESGGKTCFFCSTDCRQKFERNPAAKMQHGAPAPQPAASSTPAIRKPEAGTVVPGKPDDRQKASAQQLPGPHAGHELSPTRPMTQNTGQKHD